MKIEGMKQEFSINGRMIGEGHPVYIIAEMSANHAGSIDRAKEIIHAAKEAGADCIKIQTYTPDTLTIDCDNEYFQVKNGTWNGENLYSLYGKAYTPWEWQSELKMEADKVGIDFLSTPFDTTATDFLEDMGVEFYKIASFEMIDLPLLEYVAKKNKPIIMSTGMASEEEIREAIEQIKEAGNDKLIILKCSSAYPADPAQMNLSTITKMKEKFGVPVGLSDHSMGGFSASIAVALGAKVIEKHFCLSREIENPDASFSMTPKEFKDMVREVRKTEEALGVPSFGISKQEESSVVFRRSIFAVKDIKEGEAFTSENIRIIRPGYGLKPKYFKDICGTKAARDIKRGTPIAFDMLKKNPILFLTNNENTLDLFKWLKDREENVCLFTNKLDENIIDALKPSFIISYNYRHIIGQGVIDKMQGRIINLHTSYLPYNRGSSPNFFSFYEGTKKGVTIHVLDKGLDTGAILCQREINFDIEKESFASTYMELNKQIKELFCENWEAIKSGKITPIPQKEGGTYHTMKDLNKIREKYAFDWNDSIGGYLRKAKSEDK